MAGFWQKLLRVLPMGAGFALAATTSCSHELESPGVGTSAVEPDLVCNAQLSTPVEITGSGFTPLPTEVLQDDAVLVLPTVRLDRSSDLAGESADNATVELSGEPDGDNADHLSWQSRSQMTATIDEELGIEPGIYDLSVTNPDGKESAGIEDAIAIVPPPVLSALVPPALCNAQTDQELELQGENFLQTGDDMPTVTIATEDGSFTETFDVHTMNEDGCTGIPGRSESSSLCTNAIITIPAQTLEPGDYLVTLTNPAPAACSSTEAVVLTVNPPPTVTAVAPSQVCSGGTILNITGSDFQEGAMVDLVCDGETRASSTETTVNADGTELTATVGGGVNVGDECDVVVTNPDSCHDDPPHQSVTGVEGPILFFADPPVVFTDMETKVRLYLTTVEWPATVELAYTDADGEAQEVDLGTPDTFNDQDNRLEITVPSGLPGGPVTIQVNDDTGCTAVRDDLLTIAAEESLTLRGTDPIVPPFAEEGTSTAVTIYLDSGSSNDFEATPRVFLNPTDSSLDAVRLEGVTFEGPNRLTAVVPATAAAGQYDLVVVNPSGQVGVVQPGFDVLSDPPPVIDDVVPQSIVDQSDQTIEVRGSGFRTSTISLECVDDQGQSIAEPAVSSGALDCATAADCTQTAVVDGGAIPQGGVCVVLVTNDDGSWGKFSAIGVTNSSFNLSEPRVSPSTLSVARRALNSAAVKATTASRFVYAIAGDEGAGSAPLSSVEFAPIGVFGEVSSWVMNPTDLGTARAFAGSATIGRYVYVFGGTDGTDALGDAERALVLSPEEVPVIDDIDLCLSGGTADCFGISGIGDGLPGGSYSYRVSAVIGSGDEQNPPGEGLSSDPMVLDLREFEGRAISVELMWIPPVDSEGTTLSGISGYRIFRTPTDGGPGSEVLLAEVDDATLSYIDDGTVTLGSDAPLPIGSTSGWQALPSLATARNGPAGAAAQDPTDPNTWYVYALLGKDSGAETGGAALDTYEFVDVAIQSNGRQVVGSAWTTGAEVSSAGRWQLGAWVADNGVSANIPAGETYLYAGGGLLGGASENRDGTVEAALVTAGGELGAFDSTVTDFGSARVGYGTAAAAGRLFAFGGSAPGVRADATAAEITGAPTLANNAWNNEGLTMTEGRTLMGSSIQSAFIFLIGGEDDAGNPLASMETVVW